MARLPILSFHRWACTQEDTWSGNRHNPKRHHNRNIHYHTRHHECETFRDNLAPQLLIQMAEQISRFLLISDWDDPLPQIGNTVSASTPLSSHLRETSSTRYWRLYTETGKSLNGCPNHLHVTHHLPTFLRSLRIQQYRLPLIQATKFPLSLRIYTCLWQLSKKRKQFHNEMCILWVFGYGGGHIYHHAISGRSAYSHKLRTLVSYSLVGTFCSNTILLLIWEWHIILLYFKDIIPHKCSGV